MQTRQKAGAKALLAMEDMPEVRIEYLLIDKLKPNPRNPRRHSAEQIRMIARNMASLGPVIPLIADSKNQIWCGHGRWEAGRALGLKKLPVIRLEHLSKAQLQALAISDNRLVEAGSWNDELLGEIFLEWPELALDLTPEDLGFETAEIDLLVGAVEKPIKTDADPADDVPEQASLPQVSKPGDTWALGHHRVRCDDARKEEAYEALLVTKRASIVLSDAPYNVAVVGHVRGRGGARFREFAMASGEMSQPEYVQMLTDVFTNLATFSESGSLHYQFMDWRHMDEMLAAGHKAYDKLVNLCVWTKPSGALGSFYRSAHELVFVWRHGKERSRNNVQLGRFGRDRKNVWTYPSPTRFGGAGEENDLISQHATPKPVQLLADALLDASARGDIVVDPFLGSGSTLIAAQRTGRLCYGIEIDPLYVDLIVRRWQRFTGEHARHATSGRPFDEIAAKPARKKVVKEDPRTVKGACHE